MTPQVMRVLRKLYQHNNSQYDAERSVSTYMLQTLSDTEQDILEQYRWEANSIEEFNGHDDIIQKLIDLRDHPELSQQKMIAMFVAGVGGSFLRGRSALAAWAKLNTIETHSYNERSEFRCCWICADEDKPQQYINDSDLQYCLYLGNAYASTPLYAYLNLKHLSTLNAIQPTENDIKVLNALFDLLRSAPVDETPGQFEKRLSSAKVIKGDVYTKRGMLDSLAKVGVIPNQFIALSEKQWVDFGDIAMCEKQLKNTKGRSDMEMPWAGWQGQLKLNEGHINTLFGKYV